MSAESSSIHLPIAEWPEASIVDAVLLAREVTPGAKRDGSPFLRLVLGDLSGTVPAVMWSVNEAAQAVNAGVPVCVSGGTPTTTATARS